ncbi:uncharacterized protein B0T23DRAFT_117957 [Neurospora hispaniola]|uniref:Uncharacterized protein n=1 Tax=Neurospora hispaniola TaxID=588809 RepID=A0AAJ0IA28_9PEZI|nr:hypothetical protein B0T23DRAFT_117957 [Neurospora hispaniola]
MSVQTQNPRNLATTARFVNPEIGCPTRICAPRHLKLVTAPTMPRAHDSSRMRMRVLEKPLPATPPAAHPHTLHSAQPLLPLTGKLESGEGTLQPHVKRPCRTGRKVRRQLQGA